jgi:hypothetical protein
MKERKASDQKRDYIQNMRKTKKRATKSATIRKRNMK